MYLSTSTSTEDFPEMYLSTFQVLYKLYLSTDVLKYKVLLPGSAYKVTNARWVACINAPILLRNIVVSFNMEVPFFIESI